tara:strand:- start:2726 stop:4363 length:1638 start_codon:yes stop_codon:yes gene_type:complete
MTTPKKISKRLRKERKSKDSQIDQMKEQLAITDAIIDEYDELINKIDGKINPLLEPINNLIDEIKAAYDQRIAQNSRSNLYWEKSTTQGNKATQGEDIVTYVCKKDPSQYRFLGYYGAKFWRYPKNREYGANVIDEFSQASIAQTSSTLFVFDQIYNDTGWTNSGIATGDIITDDLQEPTIWPSGNLPRVVGIGTSIVDAYRFPSSGFTTSGTTRIYGDWKVGLGLTDGNFNVGDRLYADEDGILQNNSSITAFGQSPGEIEYIDENGNVGTFTTTLSYIDIDKTVTASIAATTGFTFSVGIMSTYNALFLDRTPTIGTSFDSFIVVRGPDNADFIFDATKNPIDPVSIGIAKGKDVGKGHRLELINNGVEKTKANWREVRQEPEPAVGNGRASYYEGHAKWPVYTEDDGQGGVATQYYATEGTTVIVNGSYASGTIDPELETTNTYNMTVGFSNVPGFGQSVPSEAAINQTIANKEQELADLIAESTPKINHYINAAKTLRSLRNEDETQAWSFLQGMGYVKEKQKTLKADADALDDFNWDDVL